MSAEPSSFGLLYVKNDDVKEVNHQSVIESFHAATNLTDHKLRIYTSSPTPADTEIAPGLWHRVHSNPKSTKLSNAEILNDLAQAAVDDGMEYLVLVNNDFTIVNSDWMKLVLDAFDEISQKLRLDASLKGFGCVNFTDVHKKQQPAMAVVHKSHLEAFGGVFIPSGFGNNLDDASRFIHEVYRHWGAASWSHSLLIDSRDVKTQSSPSVVDWKYEMLWSKVDQVQKYVDDHNTGETLQRIYVCDVVVPSYRCDLDILASICRIRVPKNWSLRFYFVVDNPSDPRATKIADKMLEVTKDEHAVVVMINEKNMGASASRNRGSDETAADWILYLDDDIHPDVDLLERYQEKMEKHADPLKHTRREIDKIAGFIGLTEFPDSDNQFAQAVMMADTTVLFYYVSQLTENPPWGVTANLLARRDRTRFDLDYPRTGGGEDIDFGIKHPGKWISAPEARVEHPWWVGGKRCYGHFWRWSQGDAQLPIKHPNHTHLCCPDGPETLLAFAAIALIALPLAFAFGGFMTALKALGWILGSMLFVVLSDVAVDVVKRFVSYAKMPKYRGWTRFKASVESNLVKNAQNYGRLYWNMKNGMWSNYAQRFDCWGGSSPSAVTWMKRDAMLRFCLNIAGSIALASMLF